MNAQLSLFTAPAADGPADHRAANTLAAARALTPQLNRSRALDRRLVAGVMTTSFGGSDTEGAWLWRDAYDAVEAAMVLQLRRLTPPSLPHITNSLPALPGIHGRAGRHSGRDEEPGQDPDPRANGHHAGDARLNGRDAGDPGRIPDGNPPGKPAVDYPNP